MYGDLVKEHFKETLLRKLSAVKDKSKVRSIINVVLYEASRVMGKEMVSSSALLVYDFAESGYTASLVFTTLGFLPWGIFFVASLNPAGEVERISVIESAKITDYDEMWLEGVIKASPDKVAREQKAILQAIYLSELSKILVVDLRKDT